MRLGVSILIDINEEWLTAKKYYLWMQIECIGYRAIQITEISAHYLCTGNLQLNLGLVLGFPVITSSPPVRFKTVDSCYRSSSRPYSSRQVERILDKIATKSRFCKTNARLKPETHKPTFIETQRSVHGGLMPGFTLGDVAGQFGHASLRTTTRYVDGSPNHRRDSFNRANVDEMI
jgi:hypothetical protein